jgi:hypothetical protein
MNLPIRFTANNAQSPCKVVKSSAVKNLLDLKYAIKIVTIYTVSKTTSKIFPEFILALLKKMDILFLLFLCLKYSL